MKLIKYLSLISLSLIFLTCAKEDVDVNEINPPENYVELQDNVMTISGETLKMIMEYDSAKIVFSGNMNEAAFKTGMILVGGISEKTPYGFLKKVTQVSVDGSNIILQVEDAGLDEAFKELKFVVDNRIQADGIQPRSICKNYKKKLDTGDLDLEVCIDGKFYFDYKNGEFLDIGLDNLSIELKKASFTASKNLVEQKEFSYTLVELPAGVPILVPGTPIILSPHFGIDLILCSPKVEAAIEIKFLEGKYEFGRKVLRIDSNNDIVDSPNNTASLNTIGLSAPEVSIEASLGVGLNFLYTYKIFNLDDAKASTGINLKSNLAFGVKNEIECQNGFLGCYYDFDITLKPIVTGKLLNWNFSEPLLPGFTVTLYKYSDEGCCFNSNEPCSDDVSFKINTDKIRCVDVNDPNEDSDDLIEYSFNVIPEGLENPSNFELSINNVPRGQYAYNTSYPLEIPQGKQEITIKDVMKPGCFATKNVESYCEGGIIILDDPTPCSEGLEFDITLEAVDCKNVLNSDEDEDDLVVYNLSTSVVAGNGSQSYKLFVDNAEYGDYLYSTNYTVDIPQGRKRIRIEDAIYNECLDIKTVEFICKNGSPEPPNGGGGISSENPTCTYKKIDPRDNQEYCTVLVCNDNDCKTWLRRNLRYNTNSSPYPENSDSKWRLGRLYSYEEVVNGNICPSGYRVATISDYHHLLDAIRSKYSLSENDTNLAKYIKASYAWDGSAGNGGDFYSKYFELFPNGYYSIWDKKYQEIGQSANLWTTDPYEGSNHSVYSINVESLGDEVYFVPVVKDAFRLGVRCVCDQDCN